jgi:antitoxin (DNA-binding transcriptional repressor) of toxin-antitoxin stability system
LVQGRPPDRATNEKEIIVSKAGQTMAKRVPFRSLPGPRQPGGWEGQVRISEGFDAPLPPEIQVAFEGSGDADDKPAKSAGTAKLLAPRQP